MKDRLLNFWHSFRAGYGEGILVNNFILLLLVAYLAPSGLPAQMFILGLISLFSLDPRKGGAIHHFWPVMALSGAILLLAFIRSDFIDYLRAGVPLGDAYWASTRYFQAPMAMWFTTWAFVFVAWKLSDSRSQRVTVFICWIYIVLVALQVLDCVGNLAMRNGFNDRFFGSHRPEMVIVESSNLNVVLLMLFWPLAMFAMQRRWLVGIGAAAITIAVGGFVVDSNAHIVVLALSALVFFAARYWPHVLTRLGLWPERVAAGVAAIIVLGFPLLVQWMSNSGFAASIHDKVPASWAARLDIWGYAVERSLEKPLWGWGYEAVRHFDPIIPKHTHNMSLQAWLELGIPGLALLAAFWFCIFWFIAPKGAGTVRRLGDAELIELGSGDRSDAAANLAPEYLARPYMLAAASAYFLLNAVSYGVWKAWLICLGALMLMVGILVIKAVRQDGKFRI